jgi:hypothetical protein
LVDFKRIQLIIQGFIDILNNIKPVIVVKRYSIKLPITILKVEIMLLIN